MLNPTIGRWMQEDPIRTEGGDANLSRDVGNNTTNLTDPSGLFPEEKPIDVKTHLDIQMPAKKDLPGIQVFEINDTATGVKGELKVAVGTSLTSKSLTDPKKNRQ